MHYQSDDDQEENHQSDDDSLCPSETASISEESRISIALERDICRKFDELFTDMFIVDRQREWPDRFLFKTFTTRNFTTLRGAIPTFVDSEFGDDFLAQSIPVLCASLRMVWILKENDHRNGKPPKKNKIDRDQIVSLLNATVRDYIVHQQDGIPVMGSILEKRTQQGSSHKEPCPPS